MGIWKAISGILSVLLSFFFVFQSYYSGILSNSYITKDILGIVTFAIASTIIVAGIFSIVSRESISNAWNVLIIFIYTSIAVGGYLLSENNKLIIAISTWCVICASVLAMFVANDNICGVFSYILILIIGFSISGVGIGINFISEKTIDNNLQSKITQVNEKKKEEEKTSEVRKEDNSSFSDRDNCDFRNAKWGDSRETVKKYETTKTFLYDEKDGLVCEISVGGYSAYAMYYFENDKLYMGIYDIEPGNYSNPGQYIVAHNSLKDQLTEKYGQPIASDIIKLNDERLIDMAGPADALKFGYVDYKSIWNTDSTYIGLNMDAENYEVMLQILYMDKNHEDSIDQNL